MSAALNKSPLARVKDEFGGKDKLVDKLVGILDAGEGSKDDLRKTLLGVANRKLVRLHAVATRTKDVGGHDKLVTTTAERLNRGQGQGLRDQAGRPLGRQAAGHALRRRAQGEGQGRRGRQGPREEGGQAASEGRQVRSKSDKSAAKAADKPAKAAKTASKRG